MALTWKAVEGSEPARQEAFVQADDTNKSFVLTEHDGAFTLQSEITGEEYSDQLATEALAKAQAEVLIDQFNIPRTGTVVA